MRPHIRALLALAVAGAVFALPVLVVRRDALSPFALTAGAFALVGLVWWGYRRQADAEAEIVGTGKRYLEYAYTSQADAVREVDRVNEEADRVAEAVERSRDR
jgi:hypothetical protein